MHRNARLTVSGRKELCRRIEMGRPVAHVADEMGVSRATAYKWWRRWNEEGRRWAVRSQQPAATDADVHVAAARAPD